MRKNIASVIDAFHAYDGYRDKTCSTNGQTIFSYNMPIAERFRATVGILKPEQAPTATTRAQVRAVFAALAGNPGVTLMTREELAELAYQRGRDAMSEADYTSPSRGDREDFHADG